MHIYIYAHRTQTFVITYVESNKGILCYGNGVIFQLLPREGGSLLAEPIKLYSVIHIFIYAHRTQSFVITYAESNKGIICYGNRVIFRLLPREGGSFLAEPTTRFESWILNFYSLPKEKVKGLEIISKYNLTSCVHL